MFLELIFTANKKGPNIKIYQEGLFAPPYNRGYHRAGRPREPVQGQAQEVHQRGVRGRGPEHFQQLYPRRFLRSTVGV